MSQSNKIIAVLAVTLLFAGGGMVVLISNTDEAYAAEGTVADPILVLPGQTWKYTPSFPAGLTPTLTVSASAVSQPTSSATYAATSGYAKVVGSSIEVTFPAEAPVGKYYVTIKAATTQPTQVDYQDVVFSTQAKLTGTGGTLYAAVGGAQDPLSVSASKSSTYTITDYGTLSSGSSKVTINSSTGALTVKNLVAGDVGSHTIKIKAIAKDNPTNEVILTVTLIIKAQISFTSSPSAGFIVTG
jgi:hypothetical protein